MKLKRIIGLLCGLVCVGVGAYFLVTGFKAKDKFGQKVKKKLTGSYSDHVKNNMVAGVVFVVVGGGLLVYFGLRKK